MTSRKNTKNSDPVRDAVLGDVLNDIINGDDSDLDIDFSEDENDDDPLYEPQMSDDSTDDDDESPENDPPVDLNLNEPVVGPAAEQNLNPTLQRRVFWKTTDTFEPLAPAPDFIPPEIPAINLPPRDYFTKYIPSDIYGQIAFFSNQSYIARTGQTLNTSDKEIRIFFGITITMSYLRYPRIRMYWQDKSRVPVIANKMTRDRYFKIRTSLKIVNDSEVSEEEKNKTKFWKLYPLIKCVRNGCLLNSPTQNVSIDEQMIPFWGHHEARQMIKGKPNPVGLKNFVLTCPNGLPLDFFLYEGKGDTIIENEYSQQLDIGGKVILRLSSRLPPGCSIYMDRYFTSINLLEVLHFASECSGTGTLQKNRIPSNCNFKTDAQLRREGRGSHSQLVISTGQVAIVKWFDNKPVVLASSVHGASPTDQCRRWDKKQKRYIDIQRPALVKNYNENMGGVDFLDRMISYYRNSARTRKWTVRLMFHFFDFAIAAGWIEYRMHQEKAETQKREILDYLGFREAIADYLLEYDEPDCDEEDGGEHDGPSCSFGPPNKRAKQQHPSDNIRKKNVGHLPDVKDTKNRCRLPGCRSNSAKHFCSMCQVFLCLVKGRNCYQLYHEL